MIKSDIDYKVNYYLETFKDENGNLIQVNTLDELGDIISARLVKDIDEILIKNLSKEQLYKIKNIIDEEIKMRSLL